MAARKWVFIVLWLLVSLSLSLTTKGQAGDLRQAGQLEERYRLQPGDVLDIKYRYTPEFNQIVTVQPDGFVTIDMVGEMKALGMTLQEVYKVLYEKANKRLKQPEITLILKEFEKPYVVVSGEVMHPGKFEIREPLTAMQAVMVAGGFNKEGAPAQVILFRKTAGQLPEVRMLNMRSGGDKALKDDPLLQPGDMLMVPQNTFMRIDQLTLVKLVDARANLMDTDVSISEVRYKITEIQQQLSHLEPRITTRRRSIPNQFSLERLNTILVELQNKKVQLLSKFQPHDRLIKEVEGEISNTREALDRAERYMAVEEESDLNPLRQTLEQELAKAKVHLAGQEAKRATLGIQVRHYHELLVTPELVNTELVKWDVPVAQNSDWFVQTVNGSER